MRAIKKVHEASYSPIADLKTWSPLPSQTVRQIDPFLFLNHHGYQEYPPGNSGLPFGPHPHRGIETVTFIIAGDIMHKDSAGNESTIEAGGVQWMTAGRGLIHAEVSSSKFKRQGGKLEILQLWLNLPARFKLTDPYYRGLQADEIPNVTAGEGNIIIKVLSGEWAGTMGVFKSFANVSLATLEFRPGGVWSLDIPAEENIFFYVVRGSLTVNSTPVRMRQLLEFENAGERITMSANDDSLIILGHAKPLNEPVVAQGPFVMNTREEIMQAYRDYEEGKFGSWNE